MTPYGLTHDDILDVLETPNRRHRVGAVAITNKGGSALP